MKLTESRLRKIIREELSRLTEQRRDIRVFAKRNPEAGRYGGAETIEVFVRPDGRGGFEYIDAMAPPGEYIEAPGFESNYADILVREIEDGDYLEETTDYYSPGEIEDRLNY